MQGDPGWNQGVVSILLVCTLDVGTHSSLIISEDYLSSYCGVNITRKDIGQCLDVWLFTKETCEKLCYSKKRNNIFLKKKKKIQSLKFT